MARRPPTDAALRGLLRRVYGLADSDAFVELGGLSGRNLQFRSRGRMWVLKQYRRRGLADLPRLDAVYDALEASSFPTPLPRRTVTGSRFSRRGTAMFAVLPWCAGGVRHQGGFSRACVRQVAGLLRRLHGVPLPGALADQASMSAPRGDQESTFHPAAEALRRRLREERFGLLGDAVERSLAAKERFLVNDRHLHASPPGRPGVLAHGDAHNENVLFDDEDGAVALLDFEDCQVADPLDDLVKFMCSSFLDVGASPPDAQMARCFLRAYHDGGICDAESLWAALGRSTRAVASSLFFETLCLERGDRAQVPYLLRDIDRLRDHRRAAQAMVAAVLGGEGGDAADQLGPS